MTQILTHEELSTLLELVGGDAGAGAGIETAGGVVAQPFDYRNQSRLSSRDLALLEGSLARHLRVHAPALGRLLRRSLQLERSPAEHRMAKDFFESLPAPCLIYVLEFKPMVSRGALIFEADLATAAVEQMLGGSDDAGAVRAELTPSVVGLSRLLADKLLSAVTGALDEHTKLNVEINHLETDPHLSQAIPGSDPLVVFRLEIQAGRASGNAYLALPAQTLACGLHDKHARQEAEVPAEIDPNGHVAGMPLEVATVMGEVPLSLGAVLDLDVGDVIRLRVGTHEPVQVRFSGVTKFLGRPGTRGGRHVVKLLGEAPSEGSHA